MAKGKDAKVAPQASSSNWLLLPKDDQPNQLGMIQIGPRNESKIVCHPIFLSGKYDGVAQVS